MTRPFGVLALVLLLACAGTETGNPSFVGELAYNTHSSDSVAVALAALENGGQSEVRVEAVWLVLGDARFVPAGDCEAGAPAEPHVTGLGAGDHATAAAARTVFKLDFGDYCALELPLWRASSSELPQAAPAVLQDRSIVVRGTLADGTAFELVSALEVDLWIGGPQTQLDLGPDRSRLLVGFDIAAWLEGFDWAQASVGTDGQIHISQADNASLLQQFEDNLTSGISLYVDAEGSGVVSTDSIRLAGAR